MNFATTSVMPLLARIVIAAAMLTSGWANCFEHVEIRRSISEGLRELDIEVITPVAPVDPESPQIEKDSDAKTEAAKPEEPTQSKIEVRDTTRGVNRIVWLLHDRWPDLGGWGTLIAWLAAISQIAAGMLLLAGLFTRVAALAVCVATGGAVLLVSGGMHGLQNMFAMNPFDWPHDPHRFIQLFAGLGLFTLALGLLFSGGGGFSIDARHKKSTPEQKSKETKNRND